jgi:Carbohydrate esterase, sialic acid-specific acetylesterase
VPGATSATLVIKSAVAADHNAKYSAVVTNSAGSVTSSEAVLTEALPMFLLAGQSNMEGNVDKELLQNILADLADTSIIDLKASLVKRIRYWHNDTNGGYAGYGYSDTMAAYESSELVRLKASGLIGANLTTPSTKVFCSWNESPLVPLQVFAPDNVRCGGPIGPEQVFGQALDKAGYSSTSVIKVAYGGTSLYDDWRSPSMGGTPNGNDLYAKLKSRIKSLKDKPASVNPSCTARACRWSAFIWFQGESDGFNKVHAETYEKNLKNFIADVRAEAGSPTLPVVIIQLGEWGTYGTGSGQNVANAQTAWVKADKNARIVNTADLSGFFHYDSASQLIIGERVALAVKSLLADTAAPK